MADQKLTDLPSLPSPIGATDLVYVVRSSTDYQATGADFPSGTGDVVGPASATDGAPALFDGATGKLLKNSTPTGTGNPVLQGSPSLTTPNIGTPSAGVLTSCTGLPIASGVSGLGAGVATFLATPSSANLATAVTDETGSGALVFATSPSLTTPALGVASATSVNKITLTAPASGATLTILDGKTLTANNSITLAGTDTTTMTFPGTSATIARTDAGNTFTGHQTIEGVTTTGATGTNKLVFDTSPTLVTPALGVATATSVNKVTVTAPATGATLTLIDGTTVTGPAATGTIATLAGAESLTNKKLGSLTTNGYVKTGSGDGTLSVDTSAGINKKTIVFTIDGNGSAITTGTKKATVRFPWAGTITKNTVLADQSGSVVIDVWKDTYTNYPPALADSITASAKPTLSTATKSEDSTLTGWTTSIAAGDTFKINVDSATTVTWVTLILEVTLT